jgi:hypothetical protein
MKYFSARFMAEPPSWECQPLTSCPAAPLESPVLRFRLWRHAIPVPQITGDTIGSQMEPWGLEDAEMVALTDLQLVMLEP